MQWVSATTRSSEWCSCTRRDISLRSIVSLLASEDISASVSGVAGFLRRYTHTGSTARQTGSGGKRKATERVKDIFEKCMRNDDETTATQIRSVLAREGYHLSVRTVLRSRTELGWTYRGSAYCQVIRDVNKAKRLEWARANLGSNFEDVIFTDECSIQMESHRRFCCHKRGELPKNKPRLAYLFTTEHKVFYTYRIYRCIQEWGCVYAAITYAAPGRQLDVLFSYRPKHPVKVHVWAGISTRGCTGICIFDGIMDAQVYKDILAQTLLPFLRDVYPNGHRFAQDNDPKHTSRAAQQFYATNNINWWLTPPESPDINPIELVWHELKEYLRREVKPHTKNELVCGIQTFWETVSVEKCRKYIGHLRKVIPRIIELDGAATGY